MSNKKPLQEQPYTALKGHLQLIRPLHENFWLTASESSLGEIWGSAKDDIYAERLEE